MGDTGFRLGKSTAHFLDKDQGFFKQVVNYFLHPTTHSRTMGFLVVLLLISVVFVNVAVLQQKQQYSSRAEAPTSVAYAPSKVSMGLALLYSSNPVIELSKKDNSNMELGSLVDRTGTASALSWVADFTLPTDRQIINFNFSFSGKYSAEESQAISIFNFSTSQWDGVDTRTIGTSITDFELTLIPNYTSYVSLQGLSRIQINTKSPTYFKGSFDNLALTVTFADSNFVPTTAPVSPTSTPLLTTPTPTPTLTSVPFPTSSSTSGIYTSTSVTLLNGAGQIVSGSYSNLSNKDGSYLTINSIPQNGFNVVNWYAEYQLPTDQYVANLSFAYAGKYSISQGQTLLLYNFKTSQWDTISYRTIGSAIASFSMASVANSASYVSSTGQVRLRAYVDSSAAFTGYYDYLPLSVTFGTKPPIPTPAPILPTIAPGTYSPASVTILNGAGQIVSGSYSNLYNKDGSYLTINSIPQNGFNVVNWYAEYQLPLGQVKNLSLSYTGRYTGNNVSFSAGQTLLLYNFKTSQWSTISYRTIGSAIASFSVASIANSASYVSSTGQVRARIYSDSSVVFTGYYDYLKLGVQ